MKLSKNDLREYRNFQRFLKLKPRFYQKMLKRSRWQKYLGITPEEALVIAQNDWVKKKSAI